MRKNPEFEELFDDDFEVTYEEYVPNEYRSSNDIYNDYDDDDDYYDDDYEDEYYESDDENSDYDHTDPDDRTKKKKRRKKKKAIELCITDGIIKDDNSYFLLRYIECILY
mgnify:CR=1 FL=1